jgi:hypothetical protein
MPVFCITTNNPEFQKLLAESGKKQGVFAMLVSKWMTKNEIYDRYPTLQELGISPINNIKLGADELFSQDLAQKIQDKLQKLYPEIKLNITNNPVWEKGKDILNQIIENEMDEDYWRNLYTQKNISNREEFESVKIPTIKNKFKPDFENVYHGTNTYDIDINGNLILTPSKNFDDKTTSISFTQIPVVAQDYMLRKGGNIIIKIDNEALGSNYDIESAEEIAVNGNQLFIVPKGQYEIITVPTLAEKMRKKYANEVEIRAEELRNNAKSDLHLIDAIYSERIAADNYSELQEYGDVDISEQAPEWYVPDEYLDSRAAKKVYEDIRSKINKKWIIDTLSNILIDQIKNTGEYIPNIEFALNDISTYGGRYAPHQSTLFEELLNEIGLNYFQRSTNYKEGEKLEKAKQKQKEFNELIDSIKILVEKEAEKSVKYYNSPEQVKLREEQKERDNINKKITQNLTQGEIDDLPFQKIGDKIIGQANIKAMSVLIDAVNQKQDTLPHEYAHHYIAWFRNTPIVQEAIKKWGSEETLVQSIGEQVVKQKGEAYNWWNKFVKWIMNQFNSLSKLEKQELTQILTDAFLTRQDLSTLGQVKPGVDELFSSNPQLANQVYEALGFENKKVTTDQSNNIRKMDSDINNGWKLHLSIKGVETFESTEDSTPSNEIEKRAVNTITILNSLKSKGLIKDYKIGNDGGQPGKNITVYIGNSKTIDTVVNSLSNNELRDSKIEGNLNLEKGISARFDSHRQDLQVENENYKLFRYGVNGIPNIKYGNSGVNQYSSEEIPYSLELLQAALGDYFSGSSIINSKLNNLYPNSLKNTFKITSQQEQQAKQLYSQYLDSIFPDSKVKDIVYHGGRKGIEFFTKYGNNNHNQSDYYTKNGIYFTDSIEYAKNPYADRYGKDGQVYRVLINIKNPIPFDKLFKTEIIENNIIVGYKNDGYVKPSEYGSTDTIDDEDLEKIKKDGYDGIIGEKIVFEPEQIHILGNKQDIEGFKEFVSGENVTNETGLDMSNDEVKAFNSLVNDGTIEIKCE